MAWDLFIMRLPKGLTNIDDLRPEHASKPMGRRATLVRKLAAVLPGLEFDEFGCATIAKPGVGSIELILGTDDPVHLVSLSARGSKGVIPTVTAIAEVLGGRVVDASSPSGLFEPEAAVHSLERSMKYAAQVRGAKPPPTRKAAAKKRKRSPR